MHLASQIFLDPGQKRALSRSVQLEAVHLEASMYPNYGNTGCGVFKGRIQNYKGFWLKINCGQTLLIRSCPIFDELPSDGFTKFGNSF